MRKALMPLLIASLGLVFSPALFAGPPAGAFVPTVSRTQDITKLTAQMVGSNANAAPRLGVAMFDQASKTQVDIQALYAIDTTTLSSSDLQAYVSALNAYNLALRLAAQTAYNYGATDTANLLAADVNALIDYTATAGTMDSLFLSAMDSLGGGTIWGTASKYPVNPF